MDDSKNSLTPGALSRLLRDYIVSSEPPGSPDDPDFQRRLMEAVRSLLKDIHYPSENELSAAKAAQAWRDFEHYFGSLEKTQATAHVALAAFKEAIGPWFSRMVEGGKEAAPKTHREMVEALGEKRVTAAFRSFDLALRALTESSAARAQKRGRAEKRALGIIEAGHQLAPTCRPKLTAKALWAAFGKYTQRKPFEVGVNHEVRGLEIYRVWRDGNFLYEERRTPAGTLKSVRFSVFQKKPYYYREIRAKFHRN